MRATSTRRAAVCGMISVDAVDRAILRQLQADGRLSNVELAERVRLSPSACLRRVRALERDGAIRGYHADVDPAAVGRGLEVTVHVELSPRTGPPSRRSRPASPRFDEVVECRRMFGMPDYLVRVAVADQDAYEAFYMNRLPSFRPGPGQLAVHHEDRQARRRRAALSGSSPEGGGTTPPACARAHR